MNSENQNASIGQFALAELQRKSDLLEVAKGKGWKSITMTI